MSGSIVPTSRGLINRGGLWDPRGRIMPTTQPPPPIPPNGFPSLVSWWDCADPSSLTLTGSNVIGIADKGPASVNLVPASAPTTGPAYTNTWLINGSNVLLPGPVTGGGGLSRFPQGAWATTPSNLTVMALVPMGAQASLNTYWALGAGSRLRIQAVGSAGVINIQLAGTSIPTTPLYVADGFSTSGLKSAPGAHVIIIARFASTGEITVDWWYNNALGTGVVTGPQISKTGYVPPAVTTVWFGGNGSAISQLWSSASGRLNTVATFNDVLSDRDVAQLKAWCFNRLGW